MGVFLSARHYGQDAADALQSTAAAAQLSLVDTRKRLHTYVSQCLAEAKPEDKEALERYLVLWSPQMGPSTAAWAARVCSDPGRLVLRCLTWIPWWIRRRLRRLFGRPFRLSRPRLEEPLCFKDDPASLPGEMFP